MLLAPATPLSTPRPFAIAEDIHPTKRCFLTFFLFDAEICVVSFSRAVCGRVFQTQGALGYVVPATLRVLCCVLVIFTRGCFSRGAPVLSLEHQRGVLGFVVLLNLANASVGGVMGFRTPPWRCSSLLVSRFFFWPNRNDNNFREPKLVSAGDVYVSFPCALYSLFACLKLT